MPSDSPGADALPEIQQVTSQQKSLLCLLAYLLLKPWSSSATAELKIYSKMNWKILIQFKAALQMPKSLHPSIN